VTLATTFWYRHACSLLTGDCCSRQSAIRHLTGARRAVPVTRRRFSGTIAKQRGISMRASGVKKQHLALSAYKWRDVTLFHY